MSNDIEEFLRRAAERRQQAARQRSAQQQAQTKSRSAPQYTDRAAERRVASPGDTEPEEVAVVAEIVEPTEAEYVSGGLAHRRDAERAAKKLANAQVVLAAPVTPESLIAAITLQLSTPDGLRQALLIREILDRPTHRW